MKKVLSYLAASVLTVLVIFLYLLAGTISSLLSWFFWSLAVIGLSKEKKSLLKELSEVEEDERYVDTSSVGLSLDQEMRLGARLEDATWRQSLRKVSQGCVLSFP
jgi:hypothetical protein